MKAFLAAHITKFLIAGLIGGVGATSFIVADRLDKPVVEGVQDKQIRQTQETEQVEIESEPEEPEEKIVEVIEPVPQVNEVVEPPANSQVATAEPSVVLTSPEELQTQVNQNTQTIIEHEQEINNQQQQINDHEQRITDIENKPTCQDATATNYGGALPCTYPQPEPVCEDQAATNYKGALPCVYPERELEPFTMAMIQDLSVNRGRVSIQLDKPEYKNADITVLADGAPLNLSRHNGELGLIYDFNPVAEKTYTITIDYKSDKHEGTITENVYSWDGLECRQFNCFNRFEFPVGITRIIFDMYPESPNQKIYYMFRASDNSWVKEGEIEKGGRLDVTFPKPILISPFVSLTVKLETNVNVRTNVRSLFVDVNGEIREIKPR